MLGGRRRAAIGVTAMLVAMMAGTVGSATGMSHPRPVAAPVLRPPSRGSVLLAGCGRGLATRWSGRRGRNHWRR